MAAKSRRPVKQLEDVLMPCKFIGPLSHFLNSLYSPIVRGAFERAFARKTGSDAGVVTPKDLFQSAQVILSAAMVDFPEELTPSEKPHAQRKSA